MKLFEIKTMNRDLRWELVVVEAKGVTALIRKYGSAWVRHGYIRMHHCKHRASHQCNIKINKEQTPGGVSILHEPADVHWWDLNCIDMFKKGMCFYETRVKDCRRCKE